MMSSSSEGDSSGVESWIEWFCKQEGNEFFCEVDRRYIEDSFNLYGLREIIGPNFKRCLDVILDRIEPTSSDEALERQVQDLYGLIHARFIITKRGQDKMRRKMKDIDFGVCPRLPCQQQPVLPVGLKDEIDVSGVMVYCPRCNDVFLPANRCGYRSDDMDLDGAYFGTTFPHLFMMQFPELWPPAPIRVESYVPRVFGFKVRLPARPLADEDTVMHDESKPNPMPAVQDQQQVANDAKK
ncbi:Casein kinase II subunit beta [Hondaea fermentalgiana]|uniref:Casein kinase II subunit beta n=1 Tax=Hondaea fermentalgiana TaxID=2315210 RepID=A0A2R5GQ71_9STRA|nr:Casein kinase II subunit beta [Hondaea fermentalgiana]|eukprot:GBG33026.1 Casein kinase II subunit beta [Hondaea fermentalgiana]